jgi:hypothetical protein
MCIWTSKINVFGTPAKIVLGPCLAPVGLQIAAWRPGPGPGAEEIDYSSSFSKAGSAMGGEPGAQTVAAAGMRFKWAFLVRHQILLHFPAELLRVRLQCDVRSDTFGLRFGLRLGVRFVVQFDGFGV